MMSKIELSYRRLCLCLSSNDLLLLLLLALLAVVFFGRRSEKPRSQEVNPKFIGAIKRCNQQREPKVVRY